MYLYSCLQRLSDWVLSTDKRQRIRVAMAGLAALLMVCCLAVMNAVAAAGLADVHLVRGWTVFSVVGLVAVYAAIRTGWSRRFKDPALTWVQIVYAMACCAVAFVIAGPARGVTLPILAVILMFGMFGLTPRQMGGILVYGLVIFSAASVWVAERGEPGYSPVIAVAYAGMTVVVLLSSTFLTTRVHATREHLRRQRRELAQALEQIRLLATHDDLTNLFNRRAMLELMAREQRRSLRSGASLLLAQLDIDHFKQVNDTHGHAVGDAALQAFARTVSASVREADVLARWGGEEFVLMLADTPLADATDLLERVRLAVAALAIPHATGTLHLTVSIGLAQHRPGEPVQHTLEQADQALYTAKALGRNRVVVAAAPGDRLPRAPAPPSAQA